MTSEGVVARRAVPALGAGPRGAVTVCVYRRLQERHAVAGLLVFGYAAGYMPARYGGLAVNPAGVAAALNALAHALSEPGPPAPATPPPVQVMLPWNALLWRRDLVPDDTLLSVREAAEALGVPKS